MALEAAELANYEFTPKIYAYIDKEEKAGITSTAAMWTGACAATWGFLVATAVVRRGTARRAASTSTSRGARATSRSAR